MNDEFELVDVVREVSFVIHKKGEPLIPRCFMTINVDGPRGHVSSLFGKYFFSSAELIIERCKKYGIKTLQGPMIPDVASAIVERFPGRAWVEHREHTSRGEPRDYLVFIVIDELG